MTQSRKVIAVIFGGRSVEHDVSVLTGLQFLDALDQSLYSGLPVYIDPEGQWWAGDALRKRSYYPHNNGGRQALIPLTLPTGLAIDRQPCFMGTKKSVFGEKAVQVPFDLAVPALHGSNGEDGNLQGLFSFNAIPYAGCRPFGAAASMDKHVTKQLLKAYNIPLLPHVLMNRPARGHFIDRKTLEPMLDADLGTYGFPFIVKPRRLGSSVGVQIVRDMDALEAALSSVFRLDNAALIEPLVPNLVEYNIAVMRRGDSIFTSAIEKPLQDSDLLDFKTKYLAGGNSGPKLDEAPSEGMESLNRELNPRSLSQSQDDLIRSVASTAFTALDLAGSVRIDFLCNGETGEIWLNEVNSIPGSFAHFLWQAADSPLSFTELTSALIDEGFALSTAERKDTSSASGNARIFERVG